MHLWKTLSALAFLIVILSLTPGMPTLAQSGDSCPAIVQAALAAVDTSCAGLGRDEACYGHTRVDVAFRQPRDPGDFDAPADRVPLADVQTLTTAPLDLASGTWGVAMMNLRASLPDTMPGQNVTFLLMGNATVENAVQPGETGNYGPMQAFYFTASLDEPACAEAPDALIVQSPEGVEVTLNVNGLEVQVGSTVIFQMAQLPGSQGAAMVATLLQGRLQATVGGAPIDLRQSRTDAAESLPTFAITLNDQNRVDGRSRLLPLRDLMREPAIRGYCRAVALSQHLLNIQPAICDAPLASFTPPASGGARRNCIIMAGGTVNLRGGPGTSYPVAGQLAAGQSVNPVGQTTGADGFTWLKLPDDTWVRADVVRARGDCAALPTVADLPLTPPPQPGGSGNGGGAPPDDVYVVEMAQCQAGQIGSIRAGQTVRFHQGVFRGPTLEEAQAVTGGNYPISIDGMVLPTFFGPVEYVEANTNPLGLYIPAGYNVYVYADWVATPGTHTVTASNVSESFSCTFAVGGDDSTT